MIFHLKWICQEIVDGGGLKFIHDILLNHRSEAELGRTLFTAILLDFPRQSWTIKNSLTKDFYPNLTLSVSF